MVEDSKQGAAKLKPAVEQVAERFATNCGTTESRRELRHLVDDLVLDLLGALRRASLKEIAQTIDALEERRKNRPASIKRAPQDRPMRDVLRAAERLRASEADGASRARDAFDITKPSELLDQVTAEPGALDARREEQPPASAKRVRQAPAPVAASLVRPAGTSHSPSNGASSVSATPAEPRPPSITLREGEQLVRSSGSGVVIRRVRSA